ncbi:MAG: YdeI/OmpD-associated family protein [bacterium]
MVNKKISTNTLHKIPTDFKKALADDLKALATWEDITPLARNEWICWVTSAKQIETRNRRINVGLSKLKSGMRRPCCWAGCPHR